MCGWVSDEFSNSNYICNRLQELCAFVVLQLQVKIMGEKVVDMKNCLYKNSKEPIEARVKDLLSRMTLEEKVGQMTQIERRVATSHAIKNLGIGMLKLYVFISFLNYHDQYDHFKLSNWFIGFLIFVFFRDRFNLIKRILKS